MIKDTPLKLNCHSIFANNIAEFVTQKRALGCKCNAAIEALNMFDDFCVSQNVNSLCITKDLMQQWCCKRPIESESTHRFRVSWARAFSRFLADNGISAPSEFHPLPKRSDDFVPYIFSKEEIMRLISTVDNCNNKPNPGSPVRHLVYPVLFRILYGCGLRVSEATKLKTADINLDNGTFIIREAKFGRDRMIAVSDSLLSVCRSYRAEEMMQSFESNYFLPARDHGYYDTSTIYADFRKYLLLSGIPHKGRGKGPRLHDIRHTFAVHTLNNWAAQGKDLYLCLPILQKYLGHTRLTSTEKYLRLVPDAYSQVTDPLERQLGTVFPEVCDEN